VNGVEVKVATVERIGEVEVLVEEALGRIGVGVNDESGAMDGGGALRFGGHFGGCSGRSLGDEDGRRKQQ